VLTTPAFPFTIPMNACTTAACHKLFTYPNAKNPVAAPSAPRSITGFRPIRSLSLPQKKFVATCAAAKQLAITPTYNPTLFGPTPGKEAVICGKYGEIEFSAVCSARLIIANTISCRVGADAQLFLPSPFRELLPFPPFPGKSTSPAIDTMSSSPHLPRVPLLCLLEKLALRDPGVLKLGGRPLPEGGFVGKVW